MGLNLESVKDKYFDCDDEKLEEEFIVKYGFDLDDFGCKFENDIESKSYWCYSVKELAYDLGYKILNMIGASDNEINSSLEGIGYKLIETVILGKKNYIHRVAYYYKDLEFMVDIAWVGNSLSVIDWDLITEEEYEKLGYDEIEWVLDDEEED